MQGPYNRNIMIQVINNGNFYGVFVVFGPNLLPWVVL